MQPAGSHINFSSQAHNLFVASEKEVFRSYRFGFNGQSLSRTCFGKKDDEVFNNKTTRKDSSSGVTTQKKNIFVILREVLINSCKKFNFFATFSTFLRIS